MVGFKERFMDQVWRMIIQHFHLEICAVDEVHWHKEPGDEEFNEITVVMRDRATENDTSVQYRRVRVDVLQFLMGGNCGGYGWNPRRGDMVYCIFYQGRKGLCIGSYWGWHEYPICRPTPYDISDKNGQYQYVQQNKCGDFDKEPYPALKKPYCFRWFHGPVTGTTGKGRDHLWLFDYCHEGDACPDCRDCDTIDHVCRSSNHGFKFYSSETESKKAHPDRGEYFVPCGAYWMFESKCCSDCESCTESTCCSDMYTAGKGYWTIQGAKCIDDLKGHIRHYPEGDMEIHSATSDPGDNTGVRCAVSAPGSDKWDFAVEIKDFSTGAYIRIEKNGEIKLYSPIKITLDAPLVEETHDNKVNEDNTVLGFCTHGGCSC